MIAKKYKIFFQTSNTFIFFKNGGLVEFSVLIEWANGNRLHPLNQIKFSHAFKFCVKSQIEENKCEMTEKLWRTFFQTKRNTFSPKMTGSHFR